MVTSRRNVSVVLITYNQEAYAVAALDAILAQECEPIDVVISDDCSTDSTYEVLLSVVNAYTGPHCVCLHRNSVNIGLTGNFNGALARTRGRIICVAAGDDVSLPDRVARTCAAFQKYPEAMLVAFDDHHINERGDVIRAGGADSKTPDRMLSLNELLMGHSTHPSGASRGFRRELFEVFGELSTKCPTEDTPYLLRGLILGAGVILSEPGIYYRRHSNNLSAPASIAKMDVEDICDQYRADLLVATRARLLSKAEGSVVESWIESTLRKRLIASKFHLSSSKLRFFLSTILFSSDLRLRQKARFAKSVIASAKK